MIRASVRHDGPGVIDNCGRQLHCEIHLMNMCTILIPYDLCDVTIYLERVCSPTCLMLWMRRRFQFCAYLLSTPHQLPVSCLDDALLADDLSLTP